MDKCKACKKRLLELKCKYSCIDYWNKRKSQIEWREEAQKNIVGQMERDRMECDYFIKKIQEKEALI